MTTPDPVVPLTPQPAAHRPIHLYRPLRQADGTLATDSIVNLYDPGTTNHYAGSIYTDQAMTMVANNPFPAVYGIIDLFFAAEAHVDIKVTKSDETTYTFPDVEVVGDTDFTGIELDISNEASRAAAAEGALAGQVATVATSVTAEATARAAETSRATAQEGSIVAQILAEASRAENVEGQVNSLISGLQAAITSLQNNQGSLPTGAVVPFAGQAPVGYLICDGSSYARSDYPNLYSYLGTQYGSVDGSSFNVPDLRGSFVRGVTAGGVVGAASAGDTHSHTTGDHALSVAELPAHNHGVNDPGHAHSVSDPGHAHGVSDPGHSHPMQFANAVGSSQVSPGGGGGVLSNGQTQGATTGIGVQPSGTGVGVNGSGTGISTQNAGSGSSHNHGNTGGASPLNPAHILMNYAIKT